MLKKAINRIGWHIRSVNHGPFGIVSENPAIFYTLLQGDCSNPFQWLYPISRELKASAVYYMCGFSWFCTESFLKSIIESKLKFDRKFQNHRLIFLANSTKELDILKNEKLDVILCSHNCFLDENIFKPGDSEKIFDAIYDSSMLSYKRHVLAKDISSLAIITYNLSNRQYFKHSQTILNHALWLNFDHAGAYNYLSPQRVNDYLNQSKVGLCLSEIEGAMYSSAQYLLSGIPVVTTFNLGGRDEFFDPKYVKWVDADPHEIRRAVIKFVEETPDEQLIRTTVLNRIEVHRRRFISIIQKIYDQNSANRDYGNEFTNQFHHKMLSWYSQKDQFLARSVS